MLSNQFKDKVERMSEPVARVLLRTSLKPNHLTVLGFVASVLTCLSYAGGKLKLAGVFLIIAGVFDILDGSLARVSGQVTPFGGFLDSVLDRYSDIIVLFGIIYYYIHISEIKYVILTLFALLGSVMVSYTRARAESIILNCEVGLMERAERMILLIIGSLFNILWLSLWILALLINITAFQRIYHTWKFTRN